MSENPNQPRKYDAVLGGQTPLPIDAAVLGGIEGIKRRLENAVVEQKIAALKEALKYGEAGLDLVIQALEHRLWKVRHTAYLLLEERKEPVVKQVRQEYTQKNNRYEIFVAMGRTGGVSDVDTLMESLENDQNCATYKLVDYTLGLVNTHQGKDRIKHYLFHGTQRQRNYAALYFKRLGAKAILALAVKQGCIDRVQAFSK